MSAFDPKRIFFCSTADVCFQPKWIYRDTAPREQIKKQIQDGDIRLVCATDAACEGLNLQRLGAQINIDLPWNPSRLEQRKGRIQRIGQARDDVHILSLRYVPVQFFDTLHP